MYKCKVFPYPIRSKHPDKVLPAANELITEWERECGDQRLHVIAKCFDNPTKVFVGPGLRHIRQDRHILDSARRLRFLPCVKELLAESTDTPIPTKDGNYLLRGRAPTGEYFRVILGWDAEGYRLVTFYPSEK